MAATLTRDQEELTFFSFPIEKKEDAEGPLNPVDGTPDLWIWGKATDGTIDGDQEIVDPDWSAKAIQAWAAKGNIRMSHDPRRPVGKGHNVHVTTDGHWVKSLIADPLAKHFIRIGVLNDYSVGISNPDFRYRDSKLDPDGKALRVITGRPDGLSSIAEISVCDRGSNFNSSFQIVKSAGGFTGQMVGDQDEIAKAAPAGLTEAALEEDTVNVDVPKSATITFSPADLAKLLAHREAAEAREDAAAFKAAGDAEAAVLGKKHREFSADDRKRLAGQGHALADGSYPVPDEDSLRRAAILARSGHGDVAAARKLIARRAEELKVPNPLDKDDDSAKAAGKCKTCGGSGKIRNGNLDCPDCDGPNGGDGDGDGGAEKQAAARDAMKTAFEAAEAFAAAISTAKAAAKAAAPDMDDNGTNGTDLHHDDGQDDDTDSDADDMDKAATPDVVKPPKVPCPSCGKKGKPSARFCGSCGKPMTADKAAKPTPGAGVDGEAGHIDPVPEHREPDGPAVEALEHDAHVPTVPDADVHQRVAAHHKAIGVPFDAGWLHDLLCPAFDPAAAKAAHPLADLSMLDDMAWQAKALDSATSAPMDQAREAALLWQHACSVKAMLPELADEILAEAHKAFRDANPGPGKAPAPGEISAQRYHRPYITAGHAAPSPGQDAPHRDPVHAGHISAGEFRRAPLAGGHAEDSPGNASQGPAPIPAPEIPGVPTRVYYTRTQRDNAAQAMRSMHDHIASTFPDICPMHGPGRMGEPGAGTRPVPAGIGGPVPHRASKTADGDATVTAAAAAETGLLGQLTPKQYRRKLEKAVLAGDISREEARSLLGLQPLAAALPEPDTIKAQQVTGELITLEAANPGMDADLLKAAFTEAAAPLLEQLAAQGRLLKKQAKALDAIAEQPDPSVTAYRGVALERQAALTKASSPPAGGTSMSQRAEHAKTSMFDAMYEQWRTAPSPEDREHAWAAMNQMTGLSFGNTMQT